jgi:hypothetical protein
LTQWYDDHGNYWSDHLAPDEDRDGHVDVPYAIAGGNNTDMFPLSQLISYPADLTVTPHPFSVELSWSSVNYTLEDGIDGYLLTRNSTSEVTSPWTGRQARPTMWMTRSYPTGVHLYPSGLQGRGVRR